MKRLTAFILALVCVLSLAGCAMKEHKNNTNPTQESIADNRNEVSVAVTEDPREIPGGTRFIIEIWDRTAEEELVCAEAEELFYEDETTEYYLDVIKSHYILVTYNNGNSEDIVTALNAGRATIADLDAFGIEYHTKSKK